MNNLVPSMLPLVVPALIGFLLPYVTVLIQNQSIQAAVNMILSAIAGVASTVVVEATTTWADFSWPNYVLAILAAWVLSGRSHQTEYPQKLTGRHEDINTTQRSQDQVIQKGSTW